MSRPKKNPADVKPRFTISIDQDLLDRIDDHRFTNRFENRTAAVIDLIHRGLIEVKREHR